jgi:hypothetical protein
VDFVRRGLLTNLSFFAPVINNFVEDSSNLLLLFFGLVRTAEITPSVLFIKVQKNAGFLFNSHGSSILVLPYDSSKFAMLSGAGEKILISRGNDDGIHMEEIGIASKQNRSFLVSAP